MPGPYTRQVDGVDLNSAADINLIYDGLETEMRVFKSADVTLATTTLTDAADLSFTVAANTDYAFEFWLVHQAAATTTGLKVAMTTVTATVNYLVYQADLPLANAAIGTDNLQTMQAQASATAITSPTTAAITTNYVNKLWGIISVSGTGGTLKVQWAGDAAANITLKKGSFGKLYKAG